MKILTLAVLLSVSLLFFGCDRTDVLKKVITHEFIEKPAFPTLRGDITVREILCENVILKVCEPGISYTNVASENHTGELTIYFDTPPERYFEITGINPDEHHPVRLSYKHTELQTDIANASPIDDSDYTEARFLLTPNGQIRFRYKLLKEKTRLLIKESFSFLEGWSASPNGNKFFWLYSGTQNADN